ncbi:hypothetical protein BDN70DRAFT_883134 [Pholiota conissans]|uniref:Uncharacterized protein n=1 Tax=Pholiota conissans TaxID=109636 RepID=A0A9P5YVG4_9AGAR|nr:hypothetical protein BDN70DRAFT_883134 [Pholiota conissans]
MRDRDRTQCQWKTSTIGNRWMGWVEGAGNDMGEDSKSSESEADGGVQIDGGWF